MAGHGTFIWTSGDVYVGGWKRGHMQGFGTKTMAIGDTYTGVTEHFSLDILGIVCVRVCVC